MEDQASVPTSLLELNALARVARVARLFVKDESKRTLGNFKSLGGMETGLRLLGQGKGPRCLICASDGNHGLAVAAAAEVAGASAQIYLPAAASQQRAERIRARGAAIVEVAGTYDDAVEAAAAAAARGEGILVPDTSRDPEDGIVGQVMCGYRRISAELVCQLPEKPSHLFVQAGVGGLAAALTEGLALYRPPVPKTVVVEPEAAACVAAGLEARKPVRIAGDLRTCAEMLSCGIASARALEILLRAEAAAITVTESQLENAVAMLHAAGGPTTTPSGAAGVAGLLAAGDEAVRRRLNLDGRSRVLLIVTEGPLWTIPGSQ